mgnify:FL=1|jgi:hypothetical protein|uniref:Dit-like phage tail protein N-terminal domain-containing protein n=1 Tax=Myoviridae sp. ctakU3 TaxID=2825135 RepID=A0A8S5P0M2_9CAUD|nr:MAG TPA: hypothetical protein [Myoviridae sp. ctakU3]
MASLQALLLGVKRSIEPSDLLGGLTGESIIPDVTISEFHSDEVTVTTHPVDTGAQISDHAYKQPATVVCSFGWSNSSRLLNSVLDSSIFRGLESANDVYKRLLKMQEERQQLKLSTGKRVYDNVIITKIQTTTTVDTENAAIIEVTFQEILLATTRTVALASIQQDISRTGGVVDQGNKSATQAQKTLLRIN